VVLALDVVHAGAFDPEGRQPLPVHTLDLDVAQHAAADEPEGSQVEVLGLEHRCLLWSCVVDCRRRFG